MPVCQNSVGQDVVPKSLETRVGSRNYAVREYAHRDTIPACIEIPREICVSWLCPRRFTRYPRRRGTLRGTTTTALNNGPKREFTLGEVTPPALRTHQAA